jgi:hypothetical protein
VKTRSCNCSNFDANPLDDADRAFGFLRQQSDSISTNLPGGGGRIANIAKPAASEFGTSPLWPTISVSIVANDFRFRGKADVR